MKVIYALQYFSFFLSLWSYNGNKDIKQERSIPHMAMRCAVYILNGKCDPSNSDALEFLLLKDFF